MLVIDPWKGLETPRRSFQLDLDMLTDQFLFSMHKDNHPNRHIIQNSRPDRRMREDILSKNLDNINHLIPDDKTISPGDYKIRLKSVHSQSVSNYIDSRPPSKVLLDNRPDICKSERSLPRRTRTTLAQLRSGYSPFLNSYMHRIGSSQSDLCPKCDLSPHTTDHLFNCPANPTTLTTSTLWYNPCKAAEFLGLRMTEEEEEEDTEHDPG